METHGKECSALPAPRNNSQTTVLRSMVRPKQAHLSLWEQWLRKHRTTYLFSKPRPRGKGSRINALSLNNQACKQLSPQEAVPLSQHPTHRVSVNSSSAWSLPRAPQPRAPQPRGAQSKGTQPRSLAQGHISNAKAVSLVNFTELPLVLKLCSWQNY